jgi:hypothetical protein
LSQPADATNKDAERTRWPVAAIRGIQRKRSIAVKVDGSIQNQKFVQYVLNDVPTLGVVSGIVGPMRHFGRVQPAELRAFVHPGSGPTVRGSTGLKDWDQAFNHNWLGDLGGPDSKTQGIDDYPYPLFVAQEVIDAFGTEAGLTREESATVKRKVYIAGLALLQAMLRWGNARETFGKGMDTTGLENVAAQNWYKFQLAAYGKILLAL